MLNKYPIHPFPSAPIVEDDVKDIVDFIFDTTSFNQYFILCAYLNNKTYMDKKIWI